MTIPNRRLEKEIALDATPEQVWEAIASGPGLTAWFGPTEVEPRVGGTSIFGTVTALEPGKRFAVQGPQTEDGSADTFEFLIQAREGEPTVLQFVHSGFRGDNWQTGYEITSMGWDMYFHTLAQYLTYFPGQAATFIGAAGPRASAGEHAWTTLLAGLGLSGGAVEGDAVRLDPDGLAPVEGVIDYLSPMRLGVAFLGVRAANGLYRFHGRAGLGATVALGHHIFSDEVDRNENERAWESWLNRLFLTPA